MNTYKEIYVSQPHLRKLIKERFAQNPEIQKELELLTKRAKTVTVTHAEWEEIKTGDKPFDYAFRCSNCHKRTPDRAYLISPDYCPHCNAIMDGHEYNNGENDLKEIIDRFFEDNSNEIKTPDEKWRIANGGYDLVAEIYHNNTPVCGIINCTNGYEINAYQDDDSIVQIVTEVLENRGIEIVNKANNTETTSTD